MKNTTEIYEKVFNKYKELLRHYELNILRLEIKTWLKNEREGNKNEMRYSDLIMLIHIALLFKTEYDDFSEMIEISSFNINTDEFLILENEMLSILRQLKIDSNVNFSECIEKINNSTTKIRNQISQSYVSRNFNEVIQELFDLDIDEMINSNPKKIRDLLNELIYLDKNESGFLPLIKYCRILLINIIKLIKGLTADADPDPPYYKIEASIEYFKKHINLLKIKISAANSSSELNRALPKRGWSWWQKLFGFE
jgi:hypothetical protein